MTSVKIEAVTPSGYDPAKKYPLFIALHGGGEFITAYVQSTQVASMTGFHWQDAAVTNKF